MVVPKIFRQNKAGLWFPPERYSSLEIVSMVENNRYLKPSSKYHDDILIAKYVNIVLGYDGTTKI